MSGIKKTINDYEDLRDNYADTREAKKHYSSVIQGLKLAEHIYKLEKIRGKHNGK